MLVGADIDSPWSLIDHLTRSLVNGQDYRCISCDHDEGLKFALWTGLNVAQSVILEALRNGSCPPAILLIGARSRDQVAVHLSDVCGNTHLLDWPGLTYLRYIFSGNDLTAAVNQALLGRLEPFSLPDSGDVLRGARAIRHWLENVRNSAAGARMLFTHASDGKLTVNPDNLLPVELQTHRHQAMLSGFAATVSLAPFLKDGEALATKMLLFADALSESQEWVNRAKRAVFDPFAPDKRQLQHIAECLERLLKHQACFLDHIQSIEARASEATGEA